VTARTMSPMTITDIPINAFDRVIVGTIGPLPKSDNGNLL